MMLNLQKIAIEAFVKELEDAYHQTYNQMDPHFGSIIEWTGRLALENIANSDALYHDLEHTINVTLVGQAMLKGKHLKEGGVSPRDWMHVMMALLCHDIGYVKGVCNQDEKERFATGVNGEMIDIPALGTDASLTPYHVDRSKLFVRERFGANALVDTIDTNEICSYIEMTRFPVPDDPKYKETASFAGLVRAADFIGQLGDPNYLRKIPALFYEFEETGENVRIGYKNPGYMRRNYTTFYWNVVVPYISDAISYLRITQEGKQWVANLQSHVFDVEHDNL
jgi:hypothetical protein